MKNKCCVDGEKLNLLATATANQLAQCLTIDELNVLSLFLVVLSDSLGLLAVTKEICCTPADEEPEPIIFDPL